MKEAARGMMNQKEMYKYQDMIDLPHPVSRTHPPMPAADRAAQFAPFAALTGHHEAVKEAARLTEERIELDEAQKAVLDRKLQEIRRQLGSGPAVSVTYFVPDLKKSGGAYVNAFGHVKGIREHEGVLVLEDGTSIPIEEIAAIHSLSKVTGRT